MVRINQHEDCPSESYEFGMPNGTCWGDGHYECSNCKHFRADFAADEELRQMMHRPIGFYLITLKK